MPESVPELRRLLQLLNNNPTMSIEITGFTDAKTKGQDNLELSKQRAWAVRHYLINNGIATQRMEHFGMGNKAFANDYLKINASINTTNRIEIKIVSLDWSMPDTESLLNRKGSSNN